MSKPWRNTAIVLFVAGLSFGGLFGDQLLAVGGEARENLRLYTELLHAAHESYGEDVGYRELVYGSIQGMLRTLDPHTSFLSPEAYDAMRERQQGSFYGLGILVSMRNDQLTVISPVEGTPAWRLGMRAGDVISTIEGEPTTSMSLDEAVDKLKGPKDTQVRITILRPGLAEPLELTVTRAEIPQTTVRYAYMIAPGTGYIRLTDFSRSTGEEMTKAIADLKAEGMERLIFDLRANGGGLLDQAIAVANLFVPAEARIVETRGRTRDSHQVYYAESGGPALDMPLVVLVNQGTASAAEIVAGAIQDHDIGLVIGSPTWGKGLVQTVYNLSYGAGVALTTAKYYTPSGRLIQRDYSSYYDYYAHFDNGDDPPQVTAPGEEFSTDTGRPVYGGGGITPDLAVELPAVEPVLQLLYARNTFFDFAVGYQAKHPIADEAWTPPEAILEEFRGWLVEQEVANEEDLQAAFADPEARTAMRRQLHADLFNAAFGPQAAHRVLAAGDTQIQAALAHFADAAALLAERQGGPGHQPRVASSEQSMQGRSDG